MGKEEVEQNTKNKKLKTSGWVTLTSSLVILGAALIIVISGGLDSNAQDNASLEVYAPPQYAVELIQRK